MGTAISVFPADRSRRWIIAPGVASTRQIVARNDSAEAVEIHLKVEQPRAVSISPAVLTLNPRQSRNVDVIVLAEWSPETDTRVVISVRDAHGNLVVNLAQELIAADSSDCSVTLAWKEPIVIDGSLSGFKFYCTLTSRSATPRTFEVDFTPHPALRFPERKKLTLEPGDSTTFEVPVEWHRNVHDSTGWNHPRVIEVTVPVSQGRRTAVVLWESIEPNIAQYLTDEDKAPTAMLPPELSAAPPFPGYVDQPPSGDADFQRLVSMKQLEQAVVGPSQPRNRLTTPVELTPPPRKGASRATYATLGIALAALLIAGVFYLRPQEPAPQTVAAYHPTPVAAFVSAGAALKRHTPRNAPHPTLSAGTARQTAALQRAAALVAVTQAAVAAPLPAPHKSSASTGTNSHAGLGVGAPAAATAGPNIPPPPHTVAAIDRGASIVALADPTVTYASGGRAVAVTWYVQSQDHAYIHVLNDRSVIIAESTVPGSRSHAIIRLPRGYHGGVSVEVIAIGYHGERVVQSASLSPPGT
jgi:hypothetical protein